MLGLGRGLELRSEGVPGVRLRRRLRLLGLEVLGGKWVGGELFVCDNGIWIY